MEQSPGTKHQIDIHLTSTKHPKIHLLCECKAHQARVQKTYACSFITVINDIGKKYKNWKIIPVFAAEDGFQAGATAMLNFYKFICLDIKEYLGKKQITITTKINSPILTNLVGKLKNGSVANNSHTFSNTSRGDIFSLKDALGYYEVLDGNNNPIAVLSDYVGDFRTGKRTIQYDQQDIFYDINSGSDLLSIEGTVTDKSETVCGPMSYTIDKKETVIKFDGKVYKINEDGSITN